MTDDLELVRQWLEVMPEGRFDELPGRFGYRLSPATAHAAQLP